MYNKVLCEESEEQMVQFRQEMKLKEEKHKVMFEKIQMENDKLLENLTRVQDENNHFKDEIFQKDKEIAILQKEIYHYEHFQDKNDRKMFLQDKKIQQLQKELDAYKLSNYVDGLAVSMTKEASLHQEESVQRKLKECENSKKSLEELMNKLEKLRESLDEKQSRIACLEELNGELDEDLQMADNEIDRLQGCVGKKEGMNANLEKWNTKLVTDLQSADAEADQLRQNVQAKEVEIQSLKQLNGELDNGIQMASQELDALHHNNAKLEDTLARVTEEKEQFEKRLDEAIDEQDMLDRWIRKLNTDKKEWKERCEKNEKMFAKTEGNLALMTGERDVKASLLVDAEEELRLTQNARTRQYYHDLTIQIGLQHLKSDMEKKMQSCNGSGIFNFRKSTSKLEIVNKLLVHVKSALNTNA
ncbi:centrosomal protein of 135 kDa-like [Clytia hemisphaerica]